MNVTMAGLVIVTLTLNIMAQPIPKHIKEKNPGLADKVFTTLLVDGSNILELSSTADTTLSSTTGKMVGGISQFLLQLRLMLKQGNFRYVYVFWDGDNSGQLRYNLLPEYKANRDKEFHDGERSDYAKAFDANLKRMYSKIFNQRDNAKTEERRKKKDIFYWQRGIVMECLEELFVRQCLCDEIEADDFIGYYVANKKPNERIVIMSNDRDLTQLISSDVIVYVQSMKKFATTKTHKDIMGYDYRNVLLKKMICGDTSDNIKGIKGVGETTLFKNFPEFKTREVSLDEVVKKAAQINEDRAKQKSKPLKWASNIVECVTDSSAGKRMYEINRRVIDLKKPMMSEEAKEMLDSMMYAPMDPEGRTMANLYRILTENGVDSMRDASYFSNFFSDYQSYINKEMKNLKS